MIKIRVLAVCMAVILAVQTAFSFTAFADYTPQTDRIFAYFTDTRGAESFFGDLQAGEADWAAYCRGRLYGAEEGSEEYTERVERKARSLLESTGFVPPTDLQRTALVLAAFGRRNEQLTNAAVYFNENLDRQRINAYIWALISCGGAEAPSGAVNSIDTLIEHILSVQLTDGGFNLMGEGADADITAAAIYALAPYSDRADVSAALERAEAALTALQCESGGFMSMGVENCESASQAIIAFTALGYGAEDERVSRAVSAVEAYSVGNGYAHVRGGKENGMATSQALMAFTALELRGRGESLFGMIESGLESQPENEIQPESSENRHENEIQPESSDNQPENETAGGLTGFQIKLIISISCVGAAIVTVIFAAVLRRKKIAAAAVVLLAAAGAVWLLDIKSPEEYYAQQGGGEIGVTVLADCSNAVSNMPLIDEGVNPADIIPADGVVIRRCEVGVPEGGTAFDALISAAREQRVRVDYQGSAYGVYITGIGYIYEFGFGSQSGWMYRVNGEVPQVSASGYELSAGDTVEFVYTCNIGGDLY